jgi:hypothetical protein
MAFRASFSGKQGLGLDTVHEVAQGVQFALQVGGNAFSFSGQIEIGRDVLGPPHQVAFERQHFLESLALAHHLLRFGGIRPEIRICCLLLDLD